MILIQLKVLYNIKNDPIHNEKKKNDSNSIKGII